MTDRIEELERRVAALERAIVAERNERELAVRLLGARVGHSEDWLNQLDKRVEALERATCTESEPDSEVAPMTPEQQPERDEVSELRARLAEVEAERDALQDSVNAVRAIVARERDQ